MLYLYLKFYICNETNFQKDLSDITQSQIDEETLFDKLLSYECLLWDK